MNTADRDTPLSRSPTLVTVVSGNRLSWRYRVVTAFSRAAFRLVLGRRLRIEGLENVPAEGPLLVVCNHISYLDPPLLSFVPGTLHIMGKVELFRNPVLRWIVTGCNCVPVARGTADRRALRTSLQILATGGRLIVFPEGGISTPPQMQRARSGVGFLLRQSGAAVIPCAITGSDRVFKRWSVRRVPVTLRFGKPIAGIASRTDAIQDVADRVGAAIAAMLPQSHRGYYGDLTDLPVEVARGA